MGAIGPAGLIFRDFLKYILPTLIAICLYSPLFFPVNTEVKVKLLIFSAFLLGYIIYSPVSMLTSFAHSILKIKGIDLSQHKLDREWCIKNYNYDALWGRLVKDEREYLYLTKSYFEFYQTTGFYFIVYAIANVYNLLSKLINSGLFIGNINSFSQIVSVNTKMIWNIDIPTLYVSLVSFFLSYFLFRNATLEYSVLFGKEGFLSMYSEKYHKEYGDIATNVWGKIKLKKEEANISSYKDTEIGLYKYDVDEPFQTTKIDKDGFFQFKNAFSQVIKSRCKLKVQHDSMYFEKTVNFYTNDIPYVEFEFNNHEKKNDNEPNE